MEESGEKEMTVTVTVTVKVSFVFVGPKELREAQKSTCFRGRRRCRCELLLPYSTPPTELLSLHSWWLLSSSASSGEGGERAGYGLVGFGSFGHGGLESWLLPYRTNYTVLYPRSLPPRLCLSLASTCQGCGLLLSLLLSSISAPRRFEFASLLAHTMQI